MPLTARVVLGEAVELLEDPFLLGVRNTDALVANGYTNVISTGLESDLDTARALRILDCVAHEVREHLPKLVAIRGDRREQRVVLRARSRPPPERACARPR